jgi:hypothetical protein
MMNDSQFISMMPNGKSEKTVKSKKVKLHEPISGLPIHCAADYDSPFNTV